MPFALAERQPALRTESSGTPAIMTMALLAPVVTGLLFAAGWSYQRRRALVAGPRGYKLHPRTRRAAIDQCEWEGVAQHDNDGASPPPRRLSAEEMRWLHPQIPSRSSGQETTNLRPGQISHPGQEQMSDEYDYLTRALEQTLQDSDDSDDAPSSVTGVKIISRS